MEQFIVEAYDKTTQRQVALHLELREDGALILQSVDHFPAVYSITVDQAMKAISSEKKV